MNKLVYISIAVYIVGLIFGFICVGWKKGVGNTDDDDYAIPLLWPVIVAFFAICLPFAIVVFGFKFIFDGLMLLGDLLHKISEKKSETSSPHHGTSTPSVTDKRRTQKNISSYGKKQDWIWKK